AFLLSAGPGDQSRIYHSADSGRHWQLQFTNSNPKGFFDSMVFWDRTHGIVLGDPIPDESGKDTGKESGKDTGKLRFELLITTNGQTWTPIPPAQLPPAADGEGAFAASNSCLAILPTAAVTSASAPRNSSEKEAASPPDPNIWFATGGKLARVFHSPDLGKTWQVFDTPILHGPDSAGIFSIAFRDPAHGVIAGGDYKHADRDGPDLAFTNDGGKTWTLSQIFPQAYFSAVAYDRGARYNDRKSKDPKAKKRDFDENETGDRLFIVAPKFIFDFRPPQDPTRISPRKRSGAQFNAVSPYPTGGALVVGPKGSIASIP
ncbi:MAG: hypothetical protein WA539_15565, partial [Candidatus Sulfotelmatobacter sp.]